MNSTAPAGPGAPSGAPARDAHLDNVKALLIALVVTGHTVGQVIDSYPRTAVLYTWLYLFHMPAFVFLCGLLTTSTTIDARRARGLVRSLLVPYVVFQVAFAAFYSFAGQEVDWGVDRMLSPLYHLWFLPALFLWRLAAPLMAQLRWPLLAALAVSLGVGMSSAVGHTMSVNRAAALLPFFVLGLLYGRRVLPRLPSGPVARAAAAATLVAALPLAALVHGTLGLRWLYWNTPYRLLGVGAVEGFALRIGLIAVALAMMAAVVVLAPRRRSFLTACGRESMYPYLLHPFVTLTFAWSGYAATSWWEIVALVTAAFALTGLLATSPVRRSLGWLVAPRTAWLFREDPARADSVRADSVRADSVGADTVRVGSSSPRPVPVSSR